MDIKSFNNQLVISNKIVNVPLSVNGYGQWQAILDNDKWKIKTWGGRDTLCTIDPTNNEAVIHELLTTGWIAGSGRAISAMETVLGISKGTYATNMVRYPYAPCRLHNTGMYDGMKINITNGEILSDKKPDLIFARTRKPKLKAQTEQIANSILAAKKLYDLPHAYGSTYVQRFIDFKLLEQAAERYDLAEFNINKVHRLKETTSNTTEYESITADNYVNHLPTLAKLLAYADPALIYNYAGVLTGHVYLRTV